MSKAKTKKPRTVHVECSTPNNYRWLCLHARGATLTDDGFEVTNESDWAESLQAANGREVN